MSPPLEREVIGPPRVKRFSSAYPAEIAYRSSSPSSLPTYWMSFFTKIRFQSRRRKAPSRLTPRKTCAKFGSAQLLVRWWQSRVMPLPTPSFGPRPFLFGPRLGWSLLGLPRPVMIVVIAFPLIAVGLIIGRGILRRRCQLTFLTVGGRRMTPTIVILITLTLITFGSSGLRKNMLRWAVLRGRLTRARGVGRGGRSLLFIGECRIPTREIPSSVTVLKLFVLPWSR